MLAKVASSSSPLTLALELVIERSTKTIEIFKKKVQEKFPSLGNSEASDLASFF